MSSTDTLDLKLSNEEITKAITLLVGSKPLNVHWNSAQAIADAATAKAAHAIQAWLDTPEARGALHTGIMLYEILTAAGIKKSD